MAAAQPEIDWAKTFGGADFDTGYSVQATPDGGYIISGCTISYSVNDYTDCWLVKVDSDGEYEWDKVYATINYDESFSVLTTPNGDYVVAGYIGPGEYDTSLWFVSSDGSDSKMISYPQFRYDEGKSVVSAPDGGYLIAGHVEDPDYYPRRYDFYVLKTDEDGVEQGRYSYGGSGDERGRSIKVTPDGGYIIAGSSPGGVYLVKANADHEQEWDGVYGGIRGNSVQLTSDGGYVVAGDSEEGVYLVKINSDGVMAWSKTYGGSTGNSLQVTPDGGYLIAGSCGEGIYLVKADKDGNKEWTEIYEGTCGNSVIITSDGNYVIAGYTQEYGEETRDMILLSTDIDLMVDFSYGPKFQDEGKSIKFVDTSTYSPEGLVEWNWDFDGLDSSDERNPAYTFMDDGVFKVSLTVTDDDGRTDTITQVVGVKDRGPTAEFESNPSSPMKGDTVRFTDQSTSTPDSLESWSWDFDGQGSSTQQNPEFTFSEAGAYTVQLTVTDDDGSTDTVTHLVTVTQPASTARFSAEPDPQGEGSAIQFTDESISPGMIVSWSWDFGGQGTSTKQNPSYTFTEDGNYLVTLTIIDDSELTSTATKTVTVTDLPPTAGFTWTPESPAEGSVIEFTDQSSSYPDEIASYAWDFDGQGTSTDTSPTYTFMADGSCTVSLTVTDADGSTSTSSQTVTVSNVQPTADFSWTPDKCEAGTTVTFTDKTTCYPDEIVSCQWDFGDGSSPCDDANPSHTYTDKGSYTVKLTVTDVDGDIDTASFTIAVAAKPLPLGLILGVIVIAAAAAAYYFLVLKKKENVTATSLRVTVNPNEIPADGRSTTEVKVEVLDSTGNPIEVTSDTPVNITATHGAVRSPVTITDGSSSATSTLSAGFDIGSVKVSAEAPGLKTGTVTIQLVERRRYCMHCGSQMPLNENTCPRCGKAPPSGVEVKTCLNCGAVIPSVAAFCGECGAGQPKEPEAPEDE